MFSVFGFFRTLSHLRIAVSGLFAFIAFLLSPESAIAQHERVHARPQTQWAQRGSETIRFNLLRLAGVPAPVRAPLQGTFKQAVVLVSFSDEAITTDPSVIEERLYGPAAETYETVRSYYTTASDGRFQVEGSVVASVTLPHPSRYYVGRRDLGLFNGVADSLPSLLRDILAQLKDVHWMPYAEKSTDGLSRVPAVVFLLAGPGGHCETGDDRVWPHRWHLTGLFGNPHPTQSRTPQGETIYLDDYIMQGIESCAGDGLTEIGVIAHETGHLLGLPDLYNTTDPNARGPVGHWDLMATGNYNTPESPALLGAWSRLFLGWVDARTPERPQSSDSTEIQIAPVNIAYEVVRLPVGGGTDEFFLLEYRTRVGPDRHLIEEGLLIWYVNPDRILEHLPSNTVNNDFEVPGVALVQADGRLDLEEGKNRGDAGDVWPGFGNKDTFAPWTIPALKSRKTGAAGDFYISGIRRTAEAVSFYLHVANAPNPVLTILPEQLLPFVRGQRVYQKFFVAESVESDSLSWSVDADLASFGLAFHETGILEGTLGSAAPDTLTFTLQVHDRKEERYGERAYRVPILSSVDVTIEEAVAALLDPTQALSPDVAMFLDAIGNRNGRYDLGDIVLAIRNNWFVLSGNAAALLHQLFW